MTYTNDIITITPLADHPEAIPQLAKIWHEVLGRIWIPDVPTDRVEKDLHNHRNTTALPITFVAHYGDQPVGMVSLRKNDGIRPDLTPWLGSLVIDPAHQNRGIGQLLITATKEKAKNMGFHELYLFALDKTIPDYYGRHGWEIIGTDTFKGHPVTVMRIGL